MSSMLQGGIGASSESHINRNHSGRISQPDHPQKIAGWASDVSCAARRLEASAGAAAGPSLKRALPVLQAIAQPVGG
jgi:hypothetical protein